MLLIDFLFQAHFELERVELTIDLFSEYDHGRIKIIIRCFVQQYFLAN